MHGECKIVLEEGTCSNATPVRPTSSPAQRAICRRRPRPPKSNMQSALFNVCLSTLYCTDPRRRIVLRPFFFIPDRVSTKGRIAHLGASASSRSTRRSSSDHPTHRPGARGIMTGCALVEPRTRFLSLASCPAALSTQPKGPATRLPASIHLSFSLPDGFFVESSVAHEQQRAGFHLVPNRWITRLPLDLI
jgi:hypothetical protein